MSKKYDVLWIDDEHESMPALHKTAVDFDITLHPFKSMNGGCAEFENNYTKYDAVLFDAKFFENESDHPGSEDTKWVHQAKDRIRKVDGSIEFFVLTGQAEAYGSREFNNAFPHVFEKGIEQDEDRLFEMLVEACQNRELTKLKHKYPSSFDMCSDSYIGVKHFDRLHNLILDIENPEGIRVAEDMLNPMRKILEALFDKLNAIGVIPDEIVQKQGALNGSSLFLSEKNYDYKYHKQIIHPIIAEGIFRLTSLTQDGSHNDGNRLEADDYFAESKTHYLYISSVYLLLDILDWMKDFIDQNNNKVTNQSKWELISENISIYSDYLSGKVIRIAENGWGTFEEEKSFREIGIPPSMVSNNHLKINQSIKIKAEPSPDGTKIFIKKIITT